MTTFDISTEDWTLWQLVMTTPSGYPMRFKVRAPSRDAAMAKAIQQKGEAWTIVLDACGNPMVWRETT